MKICLWLTTMQSIKMHILWKTKSSYKKRLSFRNPFEYDATMLNLAKILNAFSQNIKYVHQEINRDKRKASLLIMAFDFYRFTIVTTLVHIYELYLKINWIILDMYAWSSEIRRKRVTTTSRSNLMRALPYF